MSAGLQAAIRLFPGYSAAISARISRDEEFRLLCDDLADAETAFLTWEKSAAPHHDARTAEYRALFDALAAEVKAAITG